MLKKIKKKIKQFLNIILGEVQRFLNLKISYLGTPRLALEHWIQTYSPQYGKNNGKRILISSLRNPTWIEWSVYCACIIRQWGYSSTLLYRGSEINRFYNNSIKYFSFWERVKSIPDIELLDIESYEIDKDNNYQDLPDLPHILQEGVAYDNRIEPNDVIENPSFYLSEIEKLNHKIKQTTLVLDSLFKKVEFYRVFCYSGIIADTPAILASANKRKILTITLEGWWKPGQLIYNLNRPALEFNIKGWIDVLSKKWTSKEESEIDEYMNFLEGKNKDNKGWLKDFYLVHKSSVDKKLDPKINDFLNNDNRKVFLLSPNVIGDSATINRVSAFKGQKDWIEQNIEFFKKNNHLKLIIRAHPAEVWMKSKVKTRLGEFAFEKSKGIENILVIPSSDKTNTFSLIPKIHCGLVWVSTVGVDMVIKGKPVINGANPKYSEMNLTFEPNSIDEYFNKIIELSNENYSPSQGTINLAKKYHYIVYRKIGYVASSPTFRASGLNIPKIENIDEHILFYKLLTGIERFEEFDN
jgi:hypothetical protein